MAQMTGATRFISALSLAALASACVSTAVRPSPEAVVMSRFRDHEIVGVAEAHRTKEVHEFLRSLVRSRDFSGQVDDIVVEFGNARYQATMDRYISGEDVPANELRKVWRDTTVIMAWDSPLYEEFFRTVRDVNRTGAGHRLRIVLGDPPIVWEDVHDKTDYERYANRDLFLASVIQREVIARHRKGLVIAGGVHVAYDRDAKRDLPDRRRGAGELLRRAGASYFAFWRADDKPANATCENAGWPCIILVKGSPFENTSFLPFAPKGISIMKVVNGEKKWVPMEETDWPETLAMTDGLMFYPAHTFVYPSIQIYDDAYRTELRRRAAIMSEVYGMDYVEEMNSMLKETTP